MPSRVENEIIPPEGDKARHSAQRPPIRLTTRDLKTFQYGRIEARMKLPVGSGLWPAFFLMGSTFSTVGWPAAGSVDIMENVGAKDGRDGLGPNAIRSTLHGPGYFGQTGGYVVELALYADVVLLRVARSE